MVATICAGGGEVDAEGFFGEEVLPGAQHLAIDLGMQVVGQGDIDHVDVRRRRAVRGSPAF